MKRNAHVLDTGLFVALAALALTGCKESSDSSASSSTPSVETASLPAFDVTDQVVELSCGECQFGMKGTDCDLAVRIDGVAYFVDGAHIDDFGDAHAKDGLCMCIKHARISGRVENGRLAATKIEVVEDEAGG
jgi:hypothetical protein